MVAKNRENKKGRGIFSFLLAAFLVFIASFLLISNLRISNEREKIGSNLEYLEKQVDFLRKQNKETEKGLSHAESREVLERVARERLNLKAPGEEVVAIKRPESSEDESKKEEERSAWNPKTWWEWIKEKLH